MIDFDSWTSVQFAQPVTGDTFNGERASMGIKVNDWCKANCQGKAVIDNVVGDVSFELEQDAIIFSLKYL